MLICLVQLTPKAPLLFLSRCFLLLTFAIRCPFLLDLTIPAAKRELLKEKLPKDDKQLSSLPPPSPLWIETTLKVKTAWNEQDLRTSACNRINEAMDEPIPKAKVATSKNVTFLEPSGRSSITAGRQRLTLQGLSTARLKRTTCSSSASRSRFKDLWVLYTTEAFVLLTSCQSRAQKKNRNH